MASTSPALLRHYTNTRARAHVAKIARPSITTPLGGGWAPAGCHHNEPDAPDAAPEVSALGAKVSYPEVGEAVGVAVGAPDPP